jgi:hypothetical protein
MEGDDKFASIFRLNPEKIISSQISPRMECRSPILAILLEKTTLWDLFLLFPRPKSCFRSPILPTLLEMLVEEPQTP